MAELTKEMLQAKLKEATEAKAKCVQKVEEIKVKIDEMTKVKQAELDTFTKEQNELKDQVITQAVEFQGQMKILEDMIATLDAQIIPPVPAPEVK